MFPPPGRFLSSIAGLDWLALLALACGGEEVSLDPSASNLAVAKGLASTIRFDAR